VSARPRADQRGFTLVEVLVALLALAILSTFAWFGLEGVVRARDDSRAAVDRTARLATVITQWEQDLQAVIDTGAAPALAFDGQTVRLTRRVDDGVALVAWSLRNGRWQRWVGPATVRSAALQQSWFASQQQLGNEAGQLTLAEGVEGWDVYFFRGNEWSNAQSTGNLVAAPGAAPGAGPGAPPTLREELPQAVRLVVRMPAGRLTRDVLVGGG
jgi:general secretion pathway protein J